MICVIATIKVKSGKKAEFLKIFNANVPTVRAEVGCIEYYPTIDVDTGLDIQSIDKDEVVIIEKWDSVAALKDHLASIHMQVYKKQTTPIVQTVSLRVLQQQAD